ncbi:MULTISPECIES: hypothetical protein [Xanthomonas]|uniref:hypothetical protein n=1 Tax=Xanthomonas TaxID=338 RepID=UPI0012FECC05|nr:MULTISPECIES: hypothetical protein [Xanthomonas]MCW0373255.1 hypothetical protein [Xanthomonas sacchari]
MQGLNGQVCRFAAVLAGAGLAFACDAASIFSYSSNAGDYIGQGKKAVLTDANATFGVRGTKDRVELSITSTAGEYWSITIRPPVGTGLAPGVYANAERSAFKTGRSPGLDVSSTGRGCNRIWGKVSIRQVAFDAAGNVDQLEASFVQQCETNKAPALAGVVSYNAAPLYLKLNSGDGDYVGGGVDKTYYNDTSVFALDGTPSRLRYAASGLRDDWTATIAAPAGKTLVPGRYSISRFADSLNAGFDFYGNGRGCNATRGTLNVRKIEQDAQGNVVRFYADFEQFCDANSAPLRGSIHFGA